jgi:hypothetical protein
MMNDLAKEMAAKDEFYKQFVDKPFRGNMNTTTIRTTRGRTIMLQHDVTSPRVKSDGYVISGTKASALQFPVEKISIARKATPETWKGSDAQTGFLMKILKLWKKNMNQILLRNLAKLPNKWVLMEVEIF